MNTYPAAKMATMGPLVVSTANPRYFTIAEGSDAEHKAVYLTGSHIWNNFHDGMGPGAECAAMHSGRGSHSCAAITRS